MRHGAILSAIFAGVILVSGGDLSGKEIVVDQQVGQGDHDSIQEAVDAAADGDTVVVRPGTYETCVPIDVNPLYDPENPDAVPVKNITLRSEAGPEVTTIRMCETPVNDLRASVIIFESGESTSCVLEGFTLTGGKGTRWGDPGADDWQIGGGAIVCVFGSTPVIRNCIIRDNEGFRGGGLMFAEGGGPKVVDCKFHRNFAHFRHGGAVFGFHNSDASFTDCAFIGNTAMSQGGAFYLRGGAAATVTNCVIAGNNGESGGGIYCSHFEEGQGSAVFENCIITDNTVFGDGGGIFGSSNGVPIYFRRCTIAGNASTLGGGISQWNGAPAESPENGINLDRCIVWGNSPRLIHTVEGELPLAIQCCIEADDPGEGNYNDNPRFGGWKSDEVWVDSASDRIAEGTKENPFKSLAEALTSTVLREHLGLGEASDVHAFDYRLAADSPYIGKNGDETVIMIGADTGLCETAGVERRTVHIAPGEYFFCGLNLARRVSLLGAGREETVIKGSIIGPRTGETVSDLTVTEGTRGGIGTGARENPVLRNLIIRGNRSISADATPNNYGGGIWCQMGSPLIVNCRIENNWAVNELDDAGLGGGVCIWGRDYPEGSPILGKPTFINCVIAGNYARNGGGVCCIRSAKPTFINCTIADNSAIFGEDAIDFDLKGDTDPPAYPEFINSIVLGKIDDEIPAEMFGSECITDGDPDSDPLALFKQVGEFNYQKTRNGSPCSPHGSLPDFIEKEPDYHLKEGSRAIDRGVPVSALPWEIETDIDGTRRCGQIDVGAYEYCDKHAILSLSEIVACEDGKGVVYVQLTSWEEVGRFTFGIQPGQNVTITSIDHEDCPVLGNPDVWSFEPAAVDAMTVNCEISLLGCGPGTIPPGQAQSIARVTIETDACEVGAVAPLIITAPEGANAPTVFIDCEEYEAEVVMPSNTFRRGDANNDGGVHLGDAVFALNFLFKGGPEPACADAADANDDGGINVSDASYTLNYLFLGGPPIPAPGPEVCGIDPGNDNLDCEASTCDSGL